jgi:hypothetical protein
VVLSGELNPGLDSLRIQASCMLSVKGLAPKGMKGIVMPIEKSENLFLSYRLIVSPEHCLPKGIGSVNDLGVRERETSVCRFENELDNRSFLDRRYTLFILIGLPLPVSTVYMSV